MKKTFIILIILIIVLAGFIFLSKHQTDTTQTPPTATTTAGPTVTYACASNKTITATYTNGDAIPSADPSTPPTPTGSVHLVLSDGRTMDLKQTISADGTRYSNGDPNVQGGETFVFWSKGNGALVLENNQQKSYIGCVQVSNANSDVLTQTYTSPQGTYSIRTPQGYSADTTYKYQGPATGQQISGVKFTIPTSVSTGTNLGSDSYVSVEQLPQSASGSCTAGKFLMVNTENPTASASKTVTDNGTDYSYATSTDAGLGNRYEEDVYAIPGTNPCTAIRYFIHYSAIENYPAGTVKQFDETQLKSTFDQIRRSLVLNQ